MGFLDSVKDALGFGDDYGSDEYDSQEYGQNNQSQGRDYRQDSYDDGGYGNNKPNRVMNITATAQLQVILVKPSKFQETKEIADHLNNKKTVVLNLEATTPDITRRIIDFLGGVAYANGGSIKPVAHNTFIITPYNVGFQGDELSAKLENNGVQL